MQINPVIEKELKTKMRGWRAPALISIYLGFLGLIVSLYFLSNREAYDTMGSYFNPRTAIDIYNTLAVLQFGMLLMIAPAMTGAAISSERERQTLDLLLCTNLSTFAVIRGKIFVSLAHVMLLIIASLPIMSTVFLFGGVQINDMLLLFGFYLATALFLGSLGIFFSAIFKKSIVAIVVTYISVFIFTIGTFIIFAFISIVFLRGNHTPTYTETSLFLFSNPFYGFASTLDNTSSGVFFMDIFRGLNSLYTPDTLIKPWMMNIAFNLVASVILIFISAWKIKPVK